MLIDAKLPKSLWPEAVKAAVYITNRIPTRANPDDEPPISRLHQALGLNFSNDIQHLRAYGAAAYVHIPTEKRKKGEKFIECAQKGFLVGYANGLNYRIWYPDTNSIVKSAYVRFDESVRQQAVPYVRSSASPLCQPVDAIDSDLSLPAVLDNLETVPPPVAPTAHLSRELLEDMDTPSAAEARDPQVSPLADLPTAFPPLGAPLPSEPAAAAAPTSVRSSDRPNKGVPPVRLGHDTNQVLSSLPTTLLYNFSAALFKTSEGNLPKTHNDVLKHPSAAEWIAAENRELDQLSKLKVARLVILPEGARLIPSKWVYNVKRNGHYKARFVARGDKQRPGSDYTEIFANVVRPETLRLLFALICYYNLEAHCVDIMTAFLYTLMASEHPIFVRPPPGYETFDSQGRLLVWLLLKALYGLKQANLLWFLTLTGHLKEFGFFSLPSDPCVLRNSAGDLLVLWVDDIAIISSTLEGVQRIKDIISAKFEIRDLGELCDYLGLNILRDRANSRLYLTQHS
jgi:hypothetical protein